MSSQSQPISDALPATTSGAEPSGAFAPGPLIVWHQPPDCRSGDGLDWSIQTEECADVVALIALGSIGTRADLQLWSAAPDLLAALQAQEDRHQRGLFNMTNGEVEHVHALRRAAIAKALGPTAPDTSTRPAMPREEQSK